MSTLLHAPRRRQWGADRRSEPLPTVPPKATHRSMGANRGAIWVTLAAWIGYSLRTLKSELLDRTPTWSTVIPMTVYLVVAAALSTSALAYLIARQGFLIRSSQHTRATRLDLDTQFASGSPSLTVLVPSYREDTRVVRQTLLSAALQEYDDMSIVLLVDDPANPDTEEDRHLLDGALSLPWELNRLLSGPASNARNALAAFDNSSSLRVMTDSRELTELADAYQDAADALEMIADTVVRVDHTDDFLVDQVLGRLIGEFRQIATAIDDAADQDVDFTVERARQLYMRLVRVFTARVSAFQRKRFASLSHEANKAMNLNSYLSLMGGAYTISHRAGLTHLDPAVDPQSADLVVPRTEYVLTLDADSVLLPEYCLRLVHIMEQPGNERMAVAQTPYSAFPGAPTRLERLAGASTDLQHRVHQGLTHYGATYWVGANAVLRRIALDDISTTEIEHGIPVVRYIHDRTVIEDTESSIDLGTHGWTLFNYGERLSYSATPPDFGSLAIQRQRWADGGLIILPKLIQQWRSRKESDTPMRFTQFFLRLNYLASIAWSSAGLVLLLLYPFSQTLLSPLVILA
ncbi:MAG: glycosyltransferase family 2 protein, partial [Actinomycetota bacterium]